MLEFTKTAEKVLNRAKIIAKNFNSYYIGTEHLLMALVENNDSATSQILINNGVTKEKLNELIKKYTFADLNVKKVKLDDLKMSIVLKNAIIFAKNIVKYFNLPKIGTEELLLGLLRIPDNLCIRILNSLNVDIEKLQKQISKISCNGSKKNKEIFENDKDSVLNKFSIDLVNLAKNGAIQNIIGRDDEILRIEQILLRKTKNNPCLVGPPGVGKTAIVECFAKKIAENDVFDEFKNKKILSISISQIVAGTKYRGEFESRMVNLIKEVQAKKDVILFIDEIHTIIGSGGIEGSLDAANILKPALARGNFRVIGSTTDHEYVKYIQKDSSLDRRFQPIRVSEPDEKLALEILNGIKTDYEMFHNVKIKNEVLESCVKLSNRYINTRYLPDKAIDILDESCVKAKISANKYNKNLVEYKKEINEILKDREKSIINGNLKKAKDFNKKYTKLINNYFKYTEEIKTKKLKPYVTKKQVEETVSKIIGIPVSKLTMSEYNKLLNLEQQLHKRIIGQDEAVKRVVKAIKRSKVGIHDPLKPIGSFMFLGPTGVGKTQLCKVLSESLFDKKDSLIRIDMSEYMEKHALSKLIGAPPGYVGYDDFGLLTEKVKKNPYSIVLFDEIEKAHPDIFNLLLQIIDDGYITDSRGTKINFKNTIIIMTSNLGSKSIINPKKVGFINKEDKIEDYKLMKKNVLDEVNKTFRPEFINRIDDIIIFYQLTLDEIKDITKLLLKDLKDRMKKNADIKVVFDKKIVDFIVSKCNDFKFGARPIKRIIQREIEDFITDNILNRKIKANKNINIGIKNNKLFII